LWVDCSYEIHPQYVALHICSNFSPSHRQQQLPALRFYHPQVKGKPRPVRCQVYISGRKSDIAIVLIALRYLLAI